MKFLIIGLGNIGIRHIQGLSKLSDDNLEFYIFSKSNNFETKLKKKKTFKKNYKFQKKNKYFKKKLQISRCKKIS